MTNAVSALRIGRSLSEAEGLGDDYLLALAKLQIDLLTARKQSDVTIHTGQREIMRLVAAQEAVVRSQNNVFRIHDGMADIARERGLLDERDITEGSGLTNADEASMAA